MKTAERKILSLILAVTMLLASAGDIYASTKLDNYLLTSYSDDDYLELSIDESILTVSGVLDKPGMRGICVECGNSIIYQDATTGKPFSASLLLKHSGQEALNLYITASENTGWSYTANIIIIKNESGSYKFSSPSVLENNLEMHNAWVLPGEYLGEYSEEIKNLSDSIIGNESSDYKKCYLIHKWCAENIYYDYDYYYDKTSSTTFKADEILKSKRSVCEGYANMCSSLIRAQGIPSFTCHVHALGISAGNDKSFAYAAPRESTNHAIAEAFVDGRWIIMDPTWDSRNDYTDGEYNKKETYGYFYFDITPEVLSYSHQYFKRGNLQFNEGKIEASPDSQLAKIPGWALPEIKNAVENSLVPYKLQSDFTKELNRQDMCSLIINLIEVNLGKSIEEVIEDRGTVIDSTRFSDTKDNYVLSAEALGIIQGTGNGMFSPTSAITRAQAAVISGRLLDFFGETDEGSNSAFSDIKGHWCEKYLGNLASRGILKGTSETTFEPNAKLTKAQAILILNRLYENVK